jgi:hypothetical protein
MSAAGARRRAGRATSLILVWVDSRGATIVRGGTSGPVLEHIESDVPAHRRATGNVRVDPAIRHGGGGDVTNQVERHRLEHRRAFLAEVAARIAPGDDVVVLGPGPVRGHLATLLSEEPRRVASGAAVVEAPAGRRSARQLVARYLELAGSPPARVQRTSA